MRHKPPLDFSWDSRSGVQPWSHRGSRKGCWTSVCAPLGQLGGDSMEGLEHMHLPLLVHAHDKLGCLDFKAGSSQATHQFPREFPLCTSRGIILCCYNRENQKSHEIVTKRIPSPGEIPHLCAIYGMFYINSAG